MKTIVKETRTSRDFEQLRTGGLVGRRAESLADRIEQGAAGLAAFAEGDLGKRNGVHRCRKVERTAAPSA